MKFLLIAIMLTHTLFSFSQENSPQTDEQESELTDEQVSELTDEQVSELAGEQVSELTNDPAPELTTGEQVSELTNDPAPELTTGEQVSELTNDPAPELTTGEQVPELTTDEQVSKLTNEQVLELNNQAPESTNDQAPGWTLTTVVEEFLTKVEAKTPGNAQMNLLHMAATTNNLNIIKTVHAKNPDLINSTNPDNETPLLFACKTTDNIEIIEFLLEQGADVNAINNDSQTCLHLLAQQAQWDVMSWLIYEKGADPEKGRVLISTQNEDNEGYKGSLMHIAILLGENMNLVRLLAENSPSLIGIKDSDGDTPFLLACMKENLDLMNYLLQHDQVDINEQNNEAGTCLHYAATRLNIPQIKYLLDHGADPTIPNIYQNTPAHLLLIRLANQAQADSTILEQLLQHLQRHNSSENDDPPTKHNISSR